MPSVLCRTMPYRAVLGRARSVSGWLGRVGFRFQIPSHPILPYPTLPYPTLPYPILSYPILAYHSSYRIVSAAVLANHVVPAAVPHSDRCRPPSEGLVRGGPGLQGEVPGPHRRARQDGRPAPAAVRRRCGCGRQTGLLRPSISRSELPLSCPMCSATKAVRRIRASVRPPFEVVALLPKPVAGDEASPHAWRLLPLPALLLHLCGCRCCRPDGWCECGHCGGSRRELRTSDYFFDDTLNDARLLDPILLQWIRTLFVPNFSKVCNCLAQPLVKFLS